MQNLWKGILLGTAWLAVGATAVFAGGTPAVVLGIIVGFLTFFAIMTSID